ncbi:hypothetical protein OC846_006407 [Tilletia horrida]|uniref:Uncharacterized protein n=1 Tax=Tilletia horrida TaxID=155126 RepID=A0AAN6GL23_9BASI|nr:hypothetical protein OC846_006407 [Tilletia horrida]
MTPERLTRPPPVTPKGLGLLNTIEPNAQERALAERLSACSANDIAYALALVRLEQNIPSDAYHTLTQIVGTGGQGCISPMMLSDPNATNTRPSWIQEYVARRSHTTTPSTNMLSPGKTTDRATSLPPLSHLSAAHRSPSKPASAFTHDISHRSLDTDGNGRDGEEDEDEDEDIAAADMATDGRAPSPVRQVQPRPPTYIKHKARTKNAKGTSTQPVVRQKVNYTKDLATKVPEYVTRMIGPGPTDPVAVARRIIHLVLGDTGWHDNSTRAESELVINKLDRDSDISALTETLFQYAEGSSAKQIQWTWDTVIDWCMCALAQRQMQAFKSKKDPTSFLKNKTLGKRRLRGAMRWLRAATALGHIAFAPILLNIGTCFSDLSELADMNENMFGALLLFLQDGHDARDENDIQALWKTDPVTAIRRNAAIFTAKYVIRAILMLVNETFQLLCPEVDTDYRFPSATLRREEVSADLTLYIVGNAGAALDNGFTKFLSMSYKSLLQDRAAPPAKTTLHWLREESVFSSPLTDIDQEEYDVYFAAYRAVHSMADEDHADNFSATLQRILMDGGLGGLDLDPQQEYPDFCYTPMPRKLEEVAKRKGMKWMGLDEDGEWQSRPNASDRSRTITPASSDASTPDAMNDGDDTESEAMGQVSRKSNPTSSGSSTPDVMDEGADTESEVIVNTSPNIEAQADLRHELNLFLLSQASSSNIPRGSETHPPGLTFDDTGGGDHFEEEEGRLRASAGDDQTLTDNDDVDDDPARREYQRVASSVQLYADSNVRVGPAWQLAQDHSLFLFDCDIIDAEHDAVHTSVLHALFARVGMDEIRRALKGETSVRPRSLYEAGRRNALIFIASRYHRQSADHQTLHPVNTSAWRGERWLPRPCSAVPARSDEAQRMLHEYEQASVQYRDALYHTHVIQGISAPNFGIGMVHFLYMHVEHLLKPYPGAFGWFRRHFRNNENAFRDAIASVQDKEDSSDTTSSDDAGTIEPSDTTTMTVKKAGSSRRDHVRGIAVSDDLITDEEN